MCSSDLLLGRVTLVRFAFIDGNSGLFGNNLGLIREIWISQITNKNKKESSIIVCFACKYFVC